MDINFKWPGDLDHDLLEELFTRYARLERDLIVREMQLDPRVVFLEGEV